MFVSKHYTLASYADVLLAKNVSVGGQLYRKMKAIRECKTSRYLLSELLATHKFSEKNAMPNQQRIVFRESQGAWECGLS